MDLIMDLDWTENSWKCWIGMRNGLGMGWTGLSQNIWTGFWTVPNYVCLKVAALRFLGLQFVVRYGDLP